MLSEFSTLLLASEEPEDPQSEPEAKKPFPDFLEFYKKTIPRKWKADAPHLALIASELHLIRDGLSDRWAVHMPPRHAKTETITVRGAAWLFLQYQEENILITAATDRLARRFSRKVRQLVSEWIGVKLDKAADDEWTLPAGGTCIARGVGAPPVGIGFRYIFVDDPIRSRETAESKTYRDKAWDWYTDDLYTRLEPEGSIILNGTRWHHEDVFSQAVATEPEKFRVTELRAMAEEEDALGRAPGEALWPDRYDVAALLRIKRVLTQKEGEYSWQALYQQRPSPAEGDVFKPSLIQIAEALPAGLGGVRAWDLAATKNGGDWTVGARVAIDPTGIVWIIDIKRERLDTNERDALMLQTAQIDGKSVKIRVPQDPGQAGKSQVLSMLRLLMGYTVKAEPVTGSKVVRASPFSSQVNVGNVRMLKGEWNTAVIEELRTFPNGATDDIVDALADAFNDQFSPIGWATDTASLDKLKAAFGGG
jgi:predicted phage terminase large subunit-like protein